MKRVTEAELAKELREQYMKNPPEGMTSDEVRDMSDDDLLDMDYSYTNLMIWMMTISVRKVFTSSDPEPSNCHARFSAGFLFLKFPQSCIFL